MTINESALEALDLRKDRNLPTFCGKKNLPANFWTNFEKKSSGEVDKNANVLQKNKRFDEDLQ